MRYAGCTEALRPRLARSCLLRAVISCLHAPLRVPVPIVRNGVRGARTRRRGAGLPTVRDARSGATGLLSLAPAQVRLARRRGTTLERDQAGPRGAKTRAARGAARPPARRLTPARGSNSASASPSSGRAATASWRGPSSLGFAQRASHLAPLLDQLLLEVLELVAAPAHQLQLCRDVSQGLLEELPAFAGLLGLLKLAAKIGPRRLRFQKPRELIERQSQQASQPDDLPQTLHVGL